MARTASAAATTGGAIRTIPGPPPNGRSSTCLCLPSAQSRMSHRSIATRSLAIARRTMLWLRKPSKSAGKRVSTSMRCGGDPAMAATSVLRSGGGWRLRRLRSPARPRRGRGRRRARGDLPGLARCGLLHLVLVQQGLDLLRRLGPDREPVADAADIQDGLRLGVPRHRVVVPELLDRPPVARPFASPWRRCGRTGGAAVPSISSEVEPRAYSSRNHRFQSGRFRAGQAQYDQSIRLRRAAIADVGQLSPLGGPSSTVRLHVGPSLSGVDSAPRGGACALPSLVACGASRVPWARAACRSRPWGP